MNSKIFKRYATAHSLKDEKGPYVFGLNLKDARAYLKRNLPEYEVTHVTVDREGLLLDLPIASICDEFVRPEGVDFQGYFLADKVVTSTEFDSFGIILSDHYTIYEQSATMDNDDISSMVTNAFNRYYQGVVPDHDFLINITEDDGVFTINATMAIDLLKGENSVSNPWIAFFGVTKTGVFYMFDVEQGPNTLYFKGVGEFEHIRRLISRRRNVEQFCFHNYSFTQEQTHELASYLLSGCAGHGLKADWRTTPISDEVYNEFIERNWKEVLR